MVNYLAINLAFCGAERSSIQRLSRPYKKPRLWREAD